METVAPTQATAGRAARRAAVLAAVAGTNGYVSSWGAWQTGCPQTRG